MPVENFGLEEFCFQNSWREDSAWGRAHLIPTPRKKAWNRCQGVFVLISVSSAHSCCAEITGIFSKQLYQPHYGQRRNLEISSSQTNFPCLVLPGARNNSSSTLDLIGCHIFP